MKPMRFSHKYQYNLCHVQIWDIENQWSYPSNGKHELTISLLNCDWIVTSVFGAMAGPQPRSFAHLSANCAFVGKIHSWKVTKFSPPCSFHHSLSFPYIVPPNLPHSSEPCMETTQPVQRPLSETCASLLVMLGTAVTLLIPGDRGCVS